MRPSDPLLHPRHWPSWAALGLLRLIVFLPWPVIMAVGAGVGHLIHFFALRRRHIAEINLQRCFPGMAPETRRRLIRANFVAMGRGLMEVAMAWWWPQARLESLLVAIEGAEHLPPSGDGRGTIFLTAHFSSLELSGRYLGARRPCHAMYRPNENPVIQAMFERYRQAHTLGIIPRDDVRGMLRALKAGEGVWFAPDQNYGHKGKVFADFFGVPAATHPATSRFARASGARVIPFVLFRERHGYRLCIEPALDDFPSGDDQQDAARINTLFEHWARRLPAQYNWIHRRFKTRPDGGPPPYPAKRRR